MDGELTARARLALLVLAGCAPAPDAATPHWPYPSLTGARPLVIAHRGASGELPEHTLAAARLAIDQGADCIEPDLVMTADGVLVARHDLFLSKTTDVAARAEFRDRRRRDRDRDDWFVADFTLPELRTLRARQSFPGRSTAWDGQFGVPTFAELLDLAEREGARRGRPVVVYPEAKEPGWHRSRGLDLGAALLAELRPRGLDRADAPLLVQSFDPEFLRELRQRSSIRLVLLAADHDSLQRAAALAGAPFWDGIAVAHQMLFTASGASSGVLENAHAAGLFVHAWTYRDDAPFPGPRAESTAAALRRALELGIDGFFTDFPASGRRLVDHR